MESVKDREYKRTICLDFDGVIHRYSRGLYDGTIYDKPMEGAYAAIKSLYNYGYKLIVLTCRIHQHPDGNGLKEIEDWLKYYNLYEFISEITNIKPVAFLYIDDLGYRFNNWVDTLCFIYKKEMEKERNEQR